MKIVMSFRKGAAMWLLFVVGVVLVIVGLLLSFRKGSVEGMADTSSVVMLGISVDNTYFADQGLTNLPNWVGTGGTFTQVSGSMGRFMGVNSSNVISYGTRYSDTSGINWVVVPGTANQVSFDYPMAVILGSDYKFKYVDDITGNPAAAIWKVGAQITTAFLDFKYAAINLGRGYAIGTNNHLYYVDNIRVDEWVDVTGSLSGIFTQLSFDGGEVVVVDNAYNIYYANRNIETTPNWNKIYGSVKKVSLKNHMAVCIGSDNSTYFATTASAGNWVRLTTPTQFSLVELMYPTGANMITERPAVMTPCQDGYDFFNGTCLRKCRQNYTQLGFQCTGVPYVRPPVPVTTVPPLTFTCPANNDVNLLTGVTCTSISTRPGDTGNVVSSTVPLKEVFPINTGYTLTQAAAEAKCQSYGATLATRAQVTAAQAAGASWCACAWTSDDPSPLFPMTAATFPNAPIDPGCGGPTPGIKVCGIGTLAQANCYGVKPPQRQFTDVGAFNNINTGVPPGTWRAGAWNERQQCPTGYNVTTTAACYPTCPVGTYASGGSCISLSSPSVQVPIASTFTCPTGYDPPAIGTCSGATCGPAQTCYATCPPNTSPSSDKTQCVGTPYVTQTFVLPNLYPFDTLVTCRSGYTRVPHTPTTTAAVVTAAAAAAAAAIGAAAAVVLLSENRVRSKPGAAADRVLQEDNARLATLRETAKATCRIVTTRTTTLTTSTPPCQTGFEKIGNTCYKNCVSPATRNASDKICQLPPTARGVSSTATQIKSTLTMCSATQDFLQLTTCPTPNTTNYICPAGFEVPPGTATCSGSNCGQPNTCYTICPPNTSPSSDNTKCVETTYQTFVATNPDLVDTLVTCRSGSTRVPHTPTTTPAVVTAAAAAAASAIARANGFVETSVINYIWQPTAQNRDRMTNDRAKLATLRETALASCETITTHTTPATYVAPCPAQCLPKCDANSSPNPSTASTLPQCTPLSYTRSDTTEYPAIYTCNKNETLRAGVCTTICPDGTYPDGELCIADEQVVSAPSSIKCTSTAYLKAKKWMCDTSVMAAALLRDPSKTTTYVAPDDQVCVADDATTGMYYCQSGADAKAGNGTLNTARSDYTASCSNLTKNYLDLSGALNTLLLIQSSLSTGKIKVSDAATALAGIYTTQCPTRPTTTSLPTALCAKITAGSSAIADDATNIDNVKIQLNTLVTQATRARESLVANIASLHCGEALEERAGSRAPRDGVAARGLV